MMIQNYIKQVSKKYESGISKEHAYRTDLENLLRALVPEAEIISEPENVTDCGNPDFVIIREKISVGFVEAKDIGKDLKSKQYEEQFTRYRKAIDNLIISDYLWFRFFRNDKLVNEIRIAEIKDGKIIPLPERFGYFGNQIREFCAFAGLTVKSAQKLAELMAGKARLLQNILGNAVTSDEQTSENTSLRGQIEAFRKVLIHDITPKEFADIYAQTLAYGMFAARICDEPGVSDFSRRKAADLVPKSNPFLRKLFQYIAGYDIDERILPVVNNLADLFRAADMKTIMRNFGAASEQNDPVIHFYETFLEKYDPKLRKMRGVWFTPEPVVRFIVRAVDDILKSEFGLAQGLADNSEIRIRVNSQEPDKSSKTGYKQIEKTVHRVRILDPATGTGTFLAEVIRQIYHSRFRGTEGIWSSYVENDLIPRLNGFELLMASYAMAHLKLGLLLRETGFRPEKPQRFHIYLTNSLEEHHPDTGTLFCQWLSDEENEANHIKRDTPVMVVMGNPPYAVSSSNKGEWIRNLIADYKKNLNEKKLNLDDDYIKFIRYGEYLIEKNEEGILAFISNNSFIDGITHRQMRKHLLETFDKIHILDLHGNAKKKETAPDGSIDENVFDIMQGVSISLFIKSKQKKKGKLAEVFYYDLYGKRNEKYDFLSEKRIQSVDWQKLESREPYFFFVPKNFDSDKNYKKGFSMIDLFKINNSGIETGKDDLIIKEDKKFLEILINAFQSLSLEELSNIYKLSKNKLGQVKTDLENNIFEITRISYRPFDTKYTIYSPNSQGVMWRPRTLVMKHLINKNNLALVLMRQVFHSIDDYCHFFITKTIVDRRIIYSNRGAGTVFPLYLYSKDNPQQTLETNPERTPNLNMEIVRQIAEKLGLSFVPEKEDTKGTFAPIDILDYIYAMLHSPKYREKYEEFLKIDFPRVPYPKDAKQFWQLVRLGKKLREIHLLEEENLEGFQYFAEYPKDGDNVVTRKINKKDYEITDKTNQIGRVWINDGQYFDNIPKIAWEFYIGGYQPARKWLKDRHSRTLSYDDILHYQKIIKALTATEHLMKKIDKIQ